MADSTRIVFIKSILSAAGKAARGDESGMNKNLNEARGHHKTHIEKFKKDNISNPDLINEEMGLCDQYYDHVAKILGKPIKKSEYFLYKAASSKSNLYLSKPGQAKGYEYKHFSQLNANQQLQAKHKFRGAPELEEHHYPIGKDGDVAHTSRWKDPNPAATNLKSPQNIKQGIKGAVSANDTAANFPDKDKVLPHHIAGSSVRISSKDHEHDGSFGEVQSPNPYYPNKIHVKVMDKHRNGTNSIFVDPHEAVSSKSIYPQSSTKKSEDNVISLAKAALGRNKPRR